MVRETAIGRLFFAQAKHSSSRWNVRLGCVAHWLAVVTAVLVFTFSAVSTFFSYEDAAASKAAQIKWEQASAGQKRHADDAMTNMTDPFEEAVTNSAAVFPEPDNPFDIEPTVSDSHPVYLLIGLISALVIVSSGRGARYLLADE